MHWCWLTAHLYEKQISVGVTAVAQACCDPVLQSSTEQQGSYLAELLIKHYNDISGAYVVKKKDGCNSGDIRSNEFKVAS